MVKEEEWMAESRSEELVDNTTQYVAVELKVCAVVIIIMPRNLL